MAGGVENLKPIRSTERAKEIGSKGGKAKKGSKHLSTYIQEMLTDEQFEAVMLDAKKGVIEYKGAPVKAIIAVAIQKALFDKDKGAQWAEWLAKHGYGTKLVITPEDPIQALLDAYKIKDKEDDGQADTPVQRPPES